MKFIIAAFNKAIHSIAKEEVKDLIDETFDERFKVLIDTEFDKEKEKIAEVMSTKMNDLIVALENINDITSRINEKINNVSIMVDDTTAQVENTIREKLKHAIENIDNIKIDFEEVTKSVNESLSELLADIAEDDDDIEDALKKKLLDAVEKNALPYGK